MENNNFLLLTAILLTIAVIVLVVLSTYIIVTDMRARRDKVEEGFRGQKAYPPARGLVAAPSKGRHEGPPAVGLGGVDNKADVVHPEPQFPVRNEPAPEQRGSHTHVYNEAEELSFTRSSKPDRTEAPETPSRPSDALTGPYTGTTEPSSELTPVPSPPPRPTPTPQPKPQPDLPPAAKREPVSDHAAMSAVEQERDRPVDTSNEKTMAMPAVSPEVIAVAKKVATKKPAAKRAPRKKTGSTAVKVPPKST